MKGLIFTEFLDFVETRAGHKGVDRIIELSKLSSGCAYTAAGNYPYAEMSALFSAFSEISGHTLPSLLQEFGEYLFKRFSEIYPIFFEDCHDAFDFLENIKERVHTQILKFYPDAELPGIETKPISEEALLIKYRSCKPLGHLCVGLIRGCGAYFNAGLKIEAQSAKGGLDITVRRAARTVCDELKHLEAMS